MIKTKLSELETKTKQTIDKAKTLQDLEDVRISVLGKKGELTDILKGLGTLSAEERPQMGQLANKVKATILDQVTNKTETLKEKELQSQLQQDAIDTTLPSIGNNIGHRHPLNIILKEITDIFDRLGFSSKRGPDIETDFFNFTALNIPQDHPARAMHDTFYMKNKDNELEVLRTHTSPVQIRTMMKEKPPIRILAPGKVYRCDADTSHSPVFHQVEGLYVDKHVTFAELKGTLEFFLHELFGKKLKIRFRPSYFPFTEPSTEIDMSCVNCKAKGCSICKQTGWVEILGAGMVNREVFRHVNYNPDEITGFAFGVGIERVAMLKYNIPDIRLFYENDSRFLNQF